MVKGWLIMKTHIQLINGKRYAFLLNKEVDAADFFGMLMFWEIFDRKVLRINDGEHCWSFNPHLIEKIHFDFAMGAHWRSPENILSGKFVSEKSYRLKLDALRQKHGSHGTPFQPGEFAEGLAELTLASGSVEYLEFMIMLRPPQEQLMDFSLIYQKPLFPIPWEEGGFMLINPANVSMVQIYPAMTETSGSDWPMDAAAESPQAPGDASNIDSTEMKP